MKGQTQDLYQHQQSFTFSSFVFCFLSNSKTSIQRKASSSIQLMKGKFIREEDVLDICQLHVMKTLPVKLINQLSLAPVLTSYGEVVMYGRLPDHVDQQGHHVVPAAVRTVVDASGEVGGRLAVRHVEIESWLPTVVYVAGQQDGSVWGVLGRVYQGEEERGLEGERHVCYQWPYA